LSIKITQSLGQLKQWVWLTYYGQMGITTTFRTYRHVP